ncbi:hypothetical protein AB751O23_AT_00010, partial [Chlamydiales bacterium SCGC AB-751-O23]
FTSVPNGTDIIPEIVIAKGNSAVGRIVGILRTMDVDLTNEGDYHDYELVYKEASGPILTGNSTSDRSAIAQWEFDTGRTYDPDSIGLASSNFLSLMNSPQPLSGIAPPKDWLKVISEVDIDVGYYNFFVRSKDFHPTDQRNPHHEISTQFTIRIINTPSIETAATNALAAANAALATQTERDTLAASYVAPQASASSGSVIGTSSIAQTSVGDDLEDKIGSDAAILEYGSESFGVASTALFSNLGGNASLGAADLGLSLSGGSNDPASTRRDKLRAAALKRNSNNNEEVDMGDDLKGSVPGGDDSSSGDESSGDESSGDESSSDESSGDEGANNSEEEELLEETAEGEEVEGEGDETAEGEEVEGEGDDTAEGEEVEAESEDTAAEIEEADNDDTAAETKAKESVEETSDSNENTDRRET